MIGEYRSNKHILTPCKSSEMQRLETLRKQQGTIARKSCYKSMAVLESHYCQNRISNHTSRRSKVRRGRSHPHASRRGQAYRHHQQQTSLEGAQLPLLRLHNGRKLTPLPQLPPELGRRCQHRYLWTLRPQPPLMSQASHPTLFQTLHNKQSQPTSSRRTGTTGFWTYCLAKTRRWRRTGSYSFVSTAAS